jgi:hypothetical protein
MGGGGGGAWESGLARRRWWWESGGLSAQPWHGKVAWGGAFSGSAEPRVSCGGGAQGVDVSTHNAAGQAQPRGDPAGPHPQLADGLRGAPLPGAVVRLALHKQAARHRLSPQPAPPPPRRKRPVGLAQVVQAGKVVVHLRAGAGKGTRSSSRATRTRSPCGRPPFPHMRAIAAKQRPCSLRTHPPPYPPLLACRTSAWVASAGSPCTNTA